MRILFVAVVRYADGGAEEFYAIPLVRAEGAGDEATESAPDQDGGSMMLGRRLEECGVFDGAGRIDREGNCRSPAKIGELRGLQTTAYAKLSPESVADPTPKPVGAEQSNTSIIYGNRLILKFFRRIQEGINPDLEIGQFLTEKTSLKSVPPLAGDLRIPSPRWKADGAGHVAEVRSQPGDAWGFTLSSLGELLRRG